MNRRRFLISSATAIAAAPVLAHDVKTDAIDLDTLLEVMKTPGLAAKGAVNGKSFFHLAGLRAAGNTDPIVAGTLFSAASLSKPVFAMEVRRLVRDGKLDWHKPLQDYLAFGLTGDAATITAEHVLTHGTGLPNWRFDASKPELASAFKPGTQWQYSGEGYVLLQRVVEKIAGKPLGIYLNESVLPRLGMSKSTFTWSPEIDKLAVAGHDNRGRLLEKSTNFYNNGAYEVAKKAGSTPDKMTYDELIEAARKFNSLPLPVAIIPNVAGSLWTTIGDYATFLEKSMRDLGDHPDEYTPRNRVNRKISWTLSWGVDSSLDAPGYFHWGDGPGVKNFAFWQPAKKTAVVIFTNGDHGAPAYRYL
ncbi:MAG TPA: serine hydrolase domain-containing protein, partial [Thermoanaerobaculia bacterium]